MSEGKTILILGGGIGGLVTATELRQKLSSEHRIIMVDRSKQHLFQPSFLWMMVGKRNRSQISRPLENLKRKGIEVINGNVEHIDPAKRSATVNGQVIKADYMVIALGAELTPEDVPGLSEGGHNFYSVEGAENFQNELKDFKFGTIIILTSAPVYKCPAAPYEAAMLVDANCHKLGVRYKTKMEFYAAEPGPMGVAGPKVTAGVKAMLAERDIVYHPEHQVTKVDPKAKILKFANGAQASYDLLAYVPPHKVPPVVAKTALVGESGWVSVDRNNLETSFAGVYAIGDVVSIPLKMGKPLPKAGVFAHGEAEVVAKNIAAQIKGSDKKEIFLGHGACFVETGGAKAGLGSGNFFAEPLPMVNLRQPNMLWHIGKLIYEKFWLWKWF